MYNKNTENTITYECNNNDFFTDIDPDLNYINHTNKKCSYYTINEFNKDYFNFNKRKNNLSLFHTNIRSSSHNKINDLKCYLSTLNIDFSIIGLSENWGKQDTIDLRNPPGYIHHHYIRSDKRGGGVSLYVKNGIQYKLRKNFKNNENLFESVFIEIDKNEFGTNKNIIIGVINKPPNTSVKHFNEKIEKLLGLIQNEKKYDYLFGDFNVCSNYEITETDLQKQNFYHLLQSYYYHKIITVPTRVDERTQTYSLIDNIYTNIPESYADMSGVFKTHISDHYSIFSVHKSPDRITNTQYRIKRNFCEKNKSLFKKSLKKEGWAGIYKYVSVQLAYSHFNNQLKTYFDHHFPIQQTKINYSNRNEWINKALKNEIIERERLFIYKKKYRTQENIDVYTKFRNKNLSNQRKTERNYYKSY